MLPLGFDLLTFLGSTVVVVPLFKKFQISPVLGFLLSGIILHQFGLIRDPKDMEALSELGVLFLLFEMGLELSLDRLKALAKYAFGLGTLQMVLCTAIFSAFALPAGNGLGTHLLEVIAGAPHSLVSIRSVDEAVVIGGALSMSSSAFVLQLLSERGEMPTKFGSATLGILLLQDIAVVPFLVLLPLIVQLQTAAGAGPSLLVDSAASATAAVTAGASTLAAAAASNPASLVAMLGPTALKTCLGLAVLLYGGRILLRRVFELVAQSDNSETFVGLCLLTVAGAALLTSQLGFSDTMGAFTAGVLLSESNYKTQVEADIRPFRGLLLGLFFVTTGGSIDMEVLRTNWPVIGCILLGLISVKTAVVSALGPSFGLSRSESLRTGFMLSQGGEFAFVLLSLASSLHILPENLNQVLIIVVVLSMALTPGLAQLGKTAGDWVDAQCSKDEAAQAAALSANGPVLHHGVEEPVVICGFGPHGQVLATLLDQPLASLPDPTARAYVAFDLDPARVQAAREAGFNVVYGDGSRAAVLKAAGVKKPRAIAVCLTTNKAAAHKAVESLRASYPTVPLYALGADLRDAAELERAGADKCVMSSTSMGITLGTEILTSLGASMSEASQVGKDIENAITLKAHLLADASEKTAGALDAEAHLMLLGPAVTGLGMPKKSSKKSKKSSKSASSSMDEQKDAAAVAAAGGAAAAVAAAPDAAGAAAPAAAAQVVAVMVTPTAPAAADAAASPVVMMVNGRGETTVVPTADDQLATAEAAAAGTLVPADGIAALPAASAAGEPAVILVGGTPSVAMARFDCGSDEECAADEDVAGIVYVNSVATKGQLRAAQQQYQQEAAEQKQAKAQKLAAAQQQQGQTTAPATPPAGEQRVFRDDNDDDSEGSAAAAAHSRPLNGLANGSSSSSSGGGSNGGSSSEEEGRRLVGVRVGGGPSKPVPGDAGDSSSQAASVVKDPVEANTR